MLESMLFRIDSIRDPVKKHMKNISREFQVNRFSVKLYLQDRVLFRGMDKGTANDFFPTFRDKERGTQSLQLAGCLYQS